VSARRSEVWLVDFGDPVGREQSGNRPAVIVSADALNDGPASVVVVVPITTTYRGLPSHIEIDQGGSGLGLAIVKHALQRHGGQLEVQSIEGKGSTFTCHFPPQRIWHLSVQAAASA